MNGLDAIVKCGVQRELARESDEGPSEGTEGSPVGYRGKLQGNLMEVRTRGQKEVLLVTEETRKGIRWKSE